MYVNSYLVHHGILGQQWGKRNGPPYPLGSSAHSQSEKNAGWRKSLDKGSDKSENKREHKGLTDKQKKAIMIAAGVGVAVAGTYAAYKLGAFDKAAVALGKRKIQPFTTQQLHDMGIDTVDVNRIDINKVDADRISIDGVVKGDVGDGIVSKEVKHLNEITSNVNPPGPDGMRSRTNCGSCVMAVMENDDGGNCRAVSVIPEEFRRGNGLDPEVLKKAYKGVQFEKLNIDFPEGFDIDNKDPKKFIDKIQSQLNAYPDGAKGFLWTGKMKGKPGGHYVGFKKFNGKLYILESQPSSDGIVWDDLYEDIGRNMDPSSIQWCRIDGLEKNYDIINKLTEKRSV